jgi:RNA polymerase subunit RPABC4/transcription elongation factor Spt4
MQERIGTQEIEICEHCLVILLPNGECPYCGRKKDEDEEN